MKLKFYYLGYLGFLGFLGFSLGYWNFLFFIFFLFFAHNLKPAKKSMWNKIKFWLKSNWFGVGVGWFVGVSVIGYIALVDWKDLLESSIWLKIFLRFFVLLTMYLGGFIQTILRKLSKKSA